MEDDEAERQMLLARQVLDAYEDERVYALDAHAALLLSRGRVDDAIGLLGYGFGVRSASPLGRIDLSFAVSDDLSLEQTKVHVLLEQNF